MFVARWQKLLSDCRRSKAKSWRREQPSGRRRHKLAFTADTLEDRQLLAPLVTDHGGPILAKVQVETVYWGWKVDNKVPGLKGVTYGGLATNMDNFFSDITGSGYMSDLAQYGAGKGTWDKQDVVAGPVAAKVTTNDIQAMLNAEIAAGNLPAYTGNQLYFVFLPPGTSAQVIAANGKVANAPLISSGLGYHTWDVPDGYPYAVMAFPNANTLADTPFNAFSYLTELSSHELVEGITDPKAYYATPDNAMGTGWFYQNTAFEIADPFNGNWFSYPAEAGFIGGPYIVQGYWSNFIQLSTYPHEWPLIGGNPKLPGVISSPIAIGYRPPATFRPSQPGTSPPTRPTQPARPTLPAPTPPAPPTHTGPAIPGGGSQIQPTIVSSTFNPNDLAVASQNGLILSTNAGASWSNPIGFPSASSGGSSLVFDKNGNLYWSYLNTTTGGISIVTLNPSTGAIVAGPFTVNAPASGSNDVQQDLAADFSTGSSTSNNLAIVWTQLGPNGSSAILLSVSTNQGKTWLNPVTVAASSGTPPTYEYGATVTFAPNGSIAVAYHAQPGYTVASDGGIVPNGTSGETLAAIYALSGSTLIQEGSTITAFAAGQSDITFNDQAGSRKIAGTKFLTQGSVIPQILVDPTQPGLMYVVTVQDPAAGTANPPSSEVEIATLIQNSNGAWSSTTATIAPPPSASTFQLFPTASIDSGGDIVVSWYTNASGQKNSAGDYLLDTYATYSVDGGETWATPFALDSQAFDPDAGAPDVLNGPPPTTGIGNSFGVTIDGATVFVANDTNSFTGSNPTGQQVAVESFVMPGTLYVPTNLGNNVITISQQSSNSGVDVVQVNGVTVFTGSLTSLSGGIQVGSTEFPTDDLNQGAPSPNVENDTLFVNYANGDPVPSGGISFNAAEGGTNTIEVNADANDTLSDSSLTISGNSVSGTDTIDLDDVTAAQLTGGPSNDTFTLDAWTGTTTITGGTGSNTLVLAAGTVRSSTLSVSNVQTLDIAPVTGVIFTAAGNGSFGYFGDGAAATAASLNAPTSMAVDAHGDIFIADAGNNVIREVTPNGIITTVAGTGTAGYSGDHGAATAAELNDPIGVAVDASGDLFIADSGNDVIREVTPNGIITTIAGTGTAGYTGDNGQATAAELDDPTGIALSSSGNLYIADSANNVIREVSGSVISTIVGTSAMLNDPQGVAVDSSGNLFIADSGNNIIRELSGGTLTTIVGAAAMLNDPRGLAVDASGNLFIADSGNNVIREFSGGALSTVAGTGTAGYSGDGGAATAATLDNPSGVALNAQRGLLIADSGNNAVRQVTGATLDVNESLSRFATVEVQSGGVLELDNGVTLTANVTNAGTLVLGNGTSTADATIAGTFTQTSTGIFDIKLGGTAAGQYDSLKVTGNVSLAGTLDVSLVNGFVPTAGDSFQLIAYMGTLTGDFTTENFPSLASGDKFSTSSGSGSYTLSVTT
jgi:hypothetical protein